MIEHKPRTGGRKKRPAPAEPLDPLQAAIAQYLEWIAVHGFSGDTVNTRRAYLGYFHEWCHERGLSRAHRDHAADPGTLPALALSLPQDQRPAARLPHAAHAVAVHQKLLPMDGAAKSSAAQSGIRDPAAAHGAPLAQVRAHGGRSRADHPAAEHQRSRGLARPRHPGDALLNRNATHGTRESEDLRCGRRPHHADHPPRQGPEGSCDSDR